MKVPSAALLAPLALGVVQALAVPAPAPAPAPSSTKLRPRLDLNDILAYISELFPVNDTLEVAATLIEAAGSALATVLGYSTTYSDLEGGTGCGDVLLVFARGTDEPGNVGALVGPEFIEALGDAVGSAKTVKAQGVDDYDASVTEYLEGGSSSGSTKMASLVTEAFTNCPNTKVVMSGYSQGAQLVHNAASKLGASTMAKVSAVVTFGDPDSSSAVANIDSSKVMVVCHDGDDICQFGDIITLAHLTYAEDVTSAASFVVSAAGL